MKARVVGAMAYAILCRPMAMVSPKAQDRRLCQVAPTIVGLRHQRDEGSSVLGHFVRLV